MAKGQRAGLRVVDLAFELLHFGPMPDLAQLWNTARRRLAWFGGAYALFVLILALPGAQKQ